MMNSKLLRLPFLQGALMALLLGAAHAGQAPQAPDRPRPAEAVQAPDARLAKVLADWEARQHWFDTVEYRVRGEQIIPRGAYSLLSAAVVGTPPEKVIPSEDLKGPVELRVLLDFAKGRDRIDKLEQSFFFDTRKLVEQRGTDTFDGSTLKNFLPKQKNVGTGNAEMTIASGSMKGAPFTANYFPFLSAQGRVGTPLDPIIPGQLRKKPKADHFHLHGTSVYDDHPCLIVRTQVMPTTPPSFWEYWVDTACESAVRRFFSFTGKHPSEELGIQYRKFEGHWFPSAWRRTAYDRGKVLYFEDMVVEKVKVNPLFADADFDLETKPGMLVFKPETVGKPAGTSVYRVKPSGGEEQVPDPYRRKGDQFKQNSLRKEWSAWSPFVAVAFVAAVAYVTWKRRRAASKV